MIAMLRIGLAWLALLAVSVPADAAVTLTFLSRDFGESFPHAYIEVTGATDAAPAVKIAANYGFTARHLSPAVLMGPVGGEIMSVNAIYRRKSQVHFTVLLSDARYAQVMAEVEHWRTLPDPSYDLNKRNCVHFVAAIARTIGLSADDDPALMKKPRSFLEEVTAKNPQVTLPAAAAQPAKALQPAS